MISGHPCCMSDAPQLMPQTTFNALYPWALPPLPSNPVPSDREASADLGEGFRFTGHERTRHDCGPWRLGRRLGWTIASPIKATLEPIEDIPIDVEEADAQALGGVLGRDFQLWNRRVSSIAVRRNSWLHLYQFRGLDGGWQAMFLPNGEGTVEWRLGWTVDLPASHFMIVLPLDEERRFDVPTGVLSRKQMQAVAATGGMSLPFRPACRFTVERGEPLARIIVVPGDALTAG